MNTLSIIINRIGFKIVTILEKILLFNQKTIPVYPLDDYPFLKEIDNKYIAIKEELTAYNYSFFKNMEDLSIEQQRIVKQNSWKVLFLKAYGRNIPKNIPNFPITTQLLQHKAIKSAMFSALEPGTHITPHRGPYKGVLRYHLGLIIPKEWEKCAIRIDSETYHWQEGKSILFDDTYDHEAWNYTQERRVILFIDIERKLKFPFNVINKCILFVIKYSPFVKGIYSNS